MFASSRADSSNNSFAFNGTTYLTSPNWSKKDFSTPSGDGKPNQVTTGSASSRGYERFQSFAGRTSATKTTSGYSLLTWFTQETLARSQASQAYSRDDNSFETPTAPIPPFQVVRQNNTTNLNSTRCSNLNATTFDVNPGCYAAVVEGRGSARGEVGIATLSLSNPTLILSQFTDSRTYVKTATKLSVINPSEILLPNNGWGGGGKSFDGHRPGGERKDKLFEVIGEEFPNVGVVFIHRKYFKDSGGFQLFKNLCSPEYLSVELELRHKYYALAAAFALLRYMEFIHNTVYAPKTLKVEFHAPENSTMIDMETAKHVELLFSAINMKSKNTLFGIINTCSTVGGVRLLRSSLFQPPTKLAIIRCRQDAVEELIAKPEILTGVQSVLSRCCDVDQLLGLCVTVSKTSENMYVIDRKINNVIGLKHALELVEPLLTVLASAESRLLTNARSGLEDPSCSEMLEKIGAVLHDEAKVVKGTAAMRLQRCFAVRKGINGLLDVARQNYCQIVEDAERLVRELGDKHGAVLRLGYNAQRGYHVQMTNKSAGKGPFKTPKVKISELPPNFLCPQQSRNSINFTTEEIIQIDRKSQDVLKDISVMSNAILSELIVELRSTIGTLYKLSEIFALLDLVAAMAVVSSGQGFVKPSFDPDKMMVTRGRHPILNSMSSSGIGLKEVTPNDVYAKNEESNFVVLTGCNMSGKSTYLRQIVLHQVMAQIGCFVPAEEATFRICDSIFSRVSTVDSLECNASTFMVEMKEASFILNNLGSTSLVIVDELGRGTSVDEGASICWAIAEKLIKTTAFTFLATHFTLIPLLRQLYPRVETRRFITERKTEGGGEAIVHTHKLETKADRENAHEHREVEHYGLELAKVSAMPPSIVRDAFDTASLLSKENVPEVSGGRTEQQNYEQLFERLDYVASKGRICDDNQKELIVNYCKELQRLCVE